jgi:Mn-dependent DtxR family transcriptional regulator
MTDVSKVTVTSHINKLLEEGIIEKKEKRGTIQFYQLNMNNPKAKIILLLERFIVSERLKKSIVEEDDIEEEIGEKISSPSVEVPISNFSTQTRYQEESTERVDFNPLIDPRAFINSIPVVGAGYSIIKSEETHYEGETYYE